MSYPDDSNPEEWGVDGPSSTGNCSADQPQNRYPSSTPAGANPGTSAWAYDFPGLSWRGIKAYSGFAKETGGELVTIWSYRFQTWFECSSKIVGYGQWGLTINSRANPIGNVLTVKTELEVDPKSLIEPGHPDYPLAEKTYQNKTGR